VLATLSQYSSSGHRWERSARTRAKTARCDTGRLHLRFTNQRLIRRTARCRRSHPRFRGRSVPRWGSDVISRVTVPRRSSPCERARHAGRMPRRSTYPSVPLRDGAQHPAEQAPCSISGRSRAGRPCSSRIPAVSNRLQPDPTGSTAVPRFQQLLQHARLTLAQKQNREVPCTSTRIRPALAGRKHQLERATQASHTEHAALHATSSRWSDGRCLRFDADRRRAKNTHGWRVKPPAGLWRKQLAGSRVVSR